MTDFYREQYEHWFERSCRSAELIGAIDAYTDAGLTAHTITASEALARIRQLVDQFKAEQPQHEPAGR